MIKKPIFYCLLLALSIPSFAQEHEIAITIDDLPFVGFCGNNPAKLKRQEERMMKILQVLADNHIPATGFIIAGAIEKGQWELLERFRDAGITLGNHTFSHKSLDSMSAAKYIEDVDRADKILTPLFSENKYFRYPYLAEGRGDKRKQVYSYLAKNNYKIAPVTIDTKDFLFNKQLYRIPYRARMQNLDRMKQRYLTYIEKQTRMAEKQDAETNQPSKHILLLHANLLNSHFLEDVIQFYKQRNYRFISLDEALSDSTTASNKKGNEDKVDAVSNKKEEKVDSVKTEEHNPPSAKKEEKSSFDQVSYIPNIIEHDGY